MRKLHIRPAGPGSCLFSLLLLPFHIFFFPFRILTGSPRRPIDQNRW
jgi:hypothetical protein